MATTFTDADSWTINSNEALHISLGKAILSTRACRPCIPTSLSVRAEEDKELLADDENFEDFHPTFTYPVSTCTVNHWCQ